VISLSPDEKEMLVGNQGLDKQKAMELLVKYTKGLGARKLVNTNNVTVILGAIPDARIIRKIVPTLDVDEIASKFFLDSDDRVVVNRVKAFTTTNAYFYDQRYPDLQRGGKAACALSRQMAEYCARIAIVHLSTCTPYQSGNIPTKGEHCAWTESSAIAYCNAILGARTNIEGVQSSFASAITGKTPLWGMHLDENRYGRVSVNIELSMDKIQDWYLMGYYVGMHVGLDIPVYVNARKIPDLNMLMALCAAGISSGSIGMFHIVGVTPEAPTLEIAAGNRKVVKSLNFGERERRVAYEKVNRANRGDVDIVMLGCPHYSLERLSLVSEVLKGKRIHPNVALYITTCRTNKYVADRLGFTETITKGGGILFEDSCGTLFDVDSSKVLATDSAKLAHYVPGMTGLKNIWFGSTEQCIEAAITGKWRGELT